MLVKKATALALLALAPTLLVACGGSEGGDLSGSAVEEPSKPVEPAPGVNPVVPEKPGDSQPAPVAPGASGSADAVTLLGYVSSLAPTRRVDLADMKDACRASVDCQAEIALFEAHLKTLCPTEADCKDPVGMLLYKERSPQQVAQQLYSASVPQSKDVVPVVEAALAGGASGEEPAAPVEPGAAFADTLTQAAEDLKAQAGTPITWKEIGDLIVRIDPDTGNAVTEQATSAVAAVAEADPALADAVSKLLAGEAVDAADAAAVVEKIVEAANP